MSPEELDSQIRAMVRCRLIRRRYMVKNGQGDWYYKITLPGELVFHVLQLLSRLRVLQE
jgi:hypothetical protein